MSPLRCLCAYLTVPFVLMATARAGPSMPNDGGDHPLPGRLVLDLAKSPLPETSSQATVRFRQLAAGFVQEGHSTTSALQTRLAHLEQSLWQLLVATSHIPSQPDSEAQPGEEPSPGSSAPTDDQIETAVAEASGGDREGKRDHLSPTQRVTVRREILRRLRLQAPEPIELPVGMRFRKGWESATGASRLRQHSPDLDRYGSGRAKRGGEALSPARRAAILAAIMKQLDQLQSRQQVELSGMRGGK